MKHNKALKELKTILNVNFPDQIDRVILFGSRVAGRAAKYSDYDILIITKDDFDWRFKNKIFDVTWEIDYKYDLLTDIKLISTNELKTIKGKLPYIQQALEQGIDL